MGIFDIVEPQDDIEISSRTSPGILYVYAERGGILPDTSTKPTYCALEGKMGTDWMPITEKQYQNAIKVLEENGSKLKDIPGIPGLKGLHFNNCLARFGSRYFRIHEEKHSYIALSADSGNRKEIKNLALMLDLPFPKSEDDLILEEISVSGRTGP